VTQRPIEEAGLAIREPLHEAASPAEGRGDPLGLLGLLSLLAASHVGNGRGQQHQRDEERTEEGHAERQGDRLRHGLSRGILAKEADRQEDGHRRQGRQEHRAADAAHALDAGAMPREPGLAQAIDVLEHDDRVVDQHAESHRQARHRQEVERVAAEVEEGDRDQHRQRQRQRDDQRHPEPAQEEEEHQERQARAPEARLLERHQAVFDQLPLVEVVDRLEAREALLLRDLVEVAADALGGLDCVGAGCHADHAGHCDLAVHARHVLAERAHALDPRDVPQLKPAIGDGEVADRFEVRVAQLGAHDELALAFLDLADRHVLVVPLQLLQDLAEVEPELPELVSVEEDADRLADEPPHRDLADTFDALERRLNLVIDEVVVALLAARDADGHEHQRQRLVGLAPHAPAVDLRRPARPRAVQAVAHFGGGELGVDLRPRLDGDEDAAR
jgi:hypothetical protein